MLSIRESIFSNSLIQKSLLNWYYYTLFTISIISSMIKDFSRSFIIDYSQVQNYLPKRVIFTISFKTSKNWVFNTVLHLTPQPDWFFLFLIADFIDHAMRHPRIQKRSNQSQNWTETTRQDNRKRHLHVWMNYTCIQEEHEGPWYSMSS